MNFFNPFPKLDHARIVAAIADTERLTSGEIRVVIIRRKVTDPVAEARRQFERLGMTRTAARNGVLLLVAPRSRAFAIVGDTGIHQHCGDEFWREVAAELAEHFKRSEFTAGLEHAIARAGALLSIHFPRQPDDHNELPDSVVEHD